MYEEVKVLTLNTWGLHYVAKKIKERFECIADELPRYDIACLQEVWSNDDYELLVESVRSDLPYSVHYPSGIIGSGLCIFSRYPIMNVFQHEYRVTHPIRNFTNGEKFAKKGVLACRIEMPLGHGHVTVFNTHINYGFRDNQFAELMQFISSIADTSTVILCGDFNTEPHHHAYKIFTKVLRLNDSFVDDPVPTCDLPTNCFSKPNSTGKRLDYVFYSSEQFENNCSLQIKSHQLSFPGNIPGKGYPYSDHEGLEVVFNIVPPKSSHYVKDVYSDEHLQPLEALAHEINKQLAPLQNTYGSRNKYLVFLWLLLVLTSLVVSILMILPIVYNTLAKYYLQFLCSLLPSALWIASLFIFFHNLDSIHIMRGMMANYKQVKLIIDHHQKRPRNY